MRRVLLSFFFYTISIACFAQENDTVENIISEILGKSQDSLKTLYKSSYFGVPESPAFALLPNKPSEISNLVSPKDFASFVPTVISNGQIKTGIGADFRPFSGSIGEIKNYWNKPMKRVLWRTIASIGTQPVEDSEDSYLAIGLRIPLIDKGDPRAHKSRILAIEEEINKVMADYPQPPFDADSVWFAKRMEKIDSVTSKSWKEFRSNNWNAFKLNFGIANSWLLSSSSIKSDSINQDRVGVWLTASSQLTRNDQIIASINRSFVDTNKIDSLERARSVLGIKYRYILGEKLSLSVEGARIWSDFNEVEGQETRDKDWFHFGLLAEIQIPKLGGYLGLGYGINTEDDDSRFQFQYAFYFDRLENR